MTNYDCHRCQRLCSFGCGHLEQSTSSFKTVFLLGPDICAETANFLSQSDDAAHLTTIYFVLYGSTHYCYYWYCQISGDALWRGR